MTSASDRTDWVLVPVELSHEQASKLASVWGYTIEEACGSYGAILDLFARPPVPVDERVAEIEVAGDIFERLNDLCEKHGCEPGSHRLNWLDEQLTALRASTASTSGLVAALEGAKLWHESEDKALSKQPPSSGPSGTQWRRLQHQEQIATIDDALASARGET